MLPIQQSLPNRIFFSFGGSFLYTPAPALFNANYNFDIQSCAYGRLTRKVRCLRIRLGLHIYAVFQKVYPRMEVHSVVTPSIPESPRC